MGFIKADSIGNGRSYTLMQPMAENIDLSFVLEKPFYRKRLPISST